MSILVGYGQNIKHLNTKPDLQHDIFDLSTLSVSRSYPARPKTSNRKEIMERPPRYCFNVSTKAKTDTTAYRHSYYFDNKEEASIEYKKLKTRLYDQLTKPLLNKLKSTDQLSVQEQILFKSILDRMNRLS